MNSRRVARRLIEEFDGMGEGQIGICGTQGGKRWQSTLALQDRAFVDEHCRGPGRLKEREILAVREKCDLARFGVFDTSDATNLQVRGALEATSQALGNFSEFHGRLLKGEWDSIRMAHVPTNGV
jgi:hypothetical protein